jgi:hypothetical protein
MLRIEIRDVILSAVAAGLVIGWWLSRQPKHGESGDHEAGAPGWNLERHAAFARPAGRCAYEHFSKFRLN